MRRSQRQRRFRPEFQPCEDRVVPSLLLTPALIAPLVDVPPPTLTQSATINSFTNDDANSRLTAVVTLQAGTGPDQGAFSYEITLTNNVTGAQRTSPVGVANLPSGGSQTGSLTLDYLDTPYGNYTAMLTVRNTTTSSVLAKDQIGVIIEAPIPPLGAVLPSPLSPLSGTQPPSDVVTPTSPLIPLPPVPFIPGWPSPASLV